MVGEVPKGHYTIPIGKASVIREGSDLTAVAWGQQLWVLDEAAKILKVN